MGEENIQNNNQILTDVVLRQLIEEALHAARGDVVSKMDDQIGSDEALSAYVEMMARAIRERLTTERVGQAFDDYLRKPEVQDSIRERGMTQGEILAQRNAAMTQVDQIVRDSLSSSSLEEVILGHAENSMGQIPAQIDSAIDRHVEAAMARAAEARQRMFNTMADAPSIPDAAQVDVIRNDANENAARAFAEKFVAIRDSDSEQYELYKQAFANSEIHQRAFELVDSGEMDAAVTDPVVENTPGVVRP